MAPDKTSRKGNLATLEINDKVIAKSKQVLESMLEEVKHRAPKKPAETIVKENISTIDKLSKSGVSLPKIYERLNKEIPLGITSASFTQYVRNVRKQVGSELYKELGKRKSKSESKNENGVTTLESVLTQSENNLTDNVCFKCEYCKSESQRKESGNAPGNFFWKCAKCGTIYKDSNGELTNEILKSSK